MAFRVSEPTELKLKDLTQKTLAAPRIDAVHACVVVFNQYLSGPRGRNWNFVYLERCSIVTDS